MAGALLKDQLQADQSMLAEKPAAAPGVNPAQAAAVPQGVTTMVPAIEYTVHLDKGLVTKVPAQRPFDLVAGERHFGSSLDTGTMSLEQIIWLCWRALHRHTDLKFRTVGTSFDEWAESVVDISIDASSLDPLVNPEADAQTV